MRRARCLQRTPDELYQPTSSQCSSLMNSSMRCRSTCSRYASVDESLLNAENIRRFPRSLRRPRSLVRSIVTDESLKLRVAPHAIENTHDALETAARVFKEIH